MMKKMRAVVVTNNVKRYVNGFKSMIEPLIELGYEVIWVADFTAFKGDISEIPCEIYQTSFRSNPFDFNNIKAYFNLKKLLNKGGIDLIHCNTPIGGLIGRLCAKQTGIKNVVYTAHGFHFYKGAPLVNRILFKYGEKYFARYTDFLLTINQEDYKAAQKFKLRNNGKVLFIHGAGIDTGNKNIINRMEIRRQIGVPDDATMIFSAGALNKNKNNEVIINAVSKINNENLYYVLCGEGHLRTKLEKLSKKNAVSDRILFLGFRTDVLDILQAADIFTMPSFREGLPRSLMEAMDAGLPCIVSNIRGNKDLIQEGEGGFLCSPTEVNEFAKSIKTLVSDKKLREKFSITNKKNVKNYDISNVKYELKNIYKSIG